MTMSDLEVLKIWDVVNRVCLNTLGNIIPHKIMQASSKSTRVFWHEPAQSLMAATYTEMAVIQLKRSDVTASHTSHDQPISAMVYVPEFNVLATGGYCGSINIWDLSSGNKIMEYESAHTGSSVSCLSLGFGGRRLISGSSNGEIFVWNTLSGVVLQKLKKKVAREVIGVLDTKDRIYSAGWDGKLVSFLHHQNIDIAKAPIHVPEDRRWTALEKHHDDILAMDNVGDSLLATGSFDGECIIWNLKLARAVKKFDSRSYRKKLNVLKKEAGGLKHLPQVASNARTAVDAICWLKNRVKAVKSGAMTATVAISCDGGCICFWNALKGEMYGGFYAVSDKFGFESVQGMAVDNANERLFTGDSLGFVRIFDIGTYCLTGTDASCPRIVREWRAHVQAISCLLYIQHSNVVITGSADHSVRVWGADNGDFIGAFGGASTWSLFSQDECEKFSTKRSRTSVAMNSIVGGHGSGASTRSNTPTNPMAGIGGQIRPPGVEESLNSLSVEVGAGKARTSIVVNTDTGSTPSWDVGASGDESPPGKSTGVKLPPISNSSPGKGSVGALQTMDEDSEVTFTDAPGHNPDDEASNDGDDSHLQVAGGLGGVVRRNTELAAGSYMDQFKLPRINGSKGSQDWGDPKLGGDDHTELERMALDTDRQSVLGKAYSKKAVEWQTDKHSWRQITPRPDITKAAKDGLLVCVPYNTLRLGKMDEIESVRAPSAVDASRMRLERLTNGNDVRSGGEPSRSNRKGGVGRGRRPVAIKTVVGQYA